MAASTNERRAKKLLMLPYLAYGHTSPFLELAKRLSRRNFSIFFCSTSANLATVKRSIPKEYSSIRLVEIRLPALPDLPPQYHTTKGLPSRLISTLMAAFEEAGPALSDIIADLAPDLLVYDVLLPWAPPVARSCGVPTVVFSILTAAVAACSVHTNKRKGEEYPSGLTYISGFHSSSQGNSRVSLQGTRRRASNLERIMQSIEESFEIVIIKSIRELEGKQMDYLETLTGKRVVPVGVLVREPDPQEDDKDLMGWLDKKERLSTVFVAFGSECYLDEKEQEEIAYGLELSEVNFIWVIPFPEGEERKLKDTLPGGFLERVGNRGVVLEKWAPQSEILAHPSIGGFVSHCGWASVTEGLKFGVPIIAMPMLYDHPLTAMVVEEGGVGLVVQRGQGGCMNRNEIARVVKHVLSDENGKSVRKKAREIGEIIRNRGDAEIDALVDELYKILN